MVMFHVVLYIFLFFILWFGTGRILAGVDAFSHKLKLSPFLSSFFVLGLLTSIPELAVGLTAVAERKPDVFVGNLLGGIPIIFLLIIPILAIFGKGIKINHDLNPAKIILAFVVISAPSLFVLDGNVSNMEGVLCIGLYAFLLFVLERKRGVLSLFSKKASPKTNVSGSVIVNICIGTVLVFVSSHFILAETLYFARFMGISPFYLSLILVSLGTNIPELSLAIRSIVQKKKDIAFGDYMGSAAANTLLFGVFTLLVHGQSFQVHNFYMTFMTIVGGLCLFYYFARTKKEVSQIEGVLLLGIYILFVLFEFFFTQA